MKMPEKTLTTPEATVVPTGELLKLRPSDVKPNPSNPRLLFDPEPLRDLRENIRIHGVLVPITVYPLPGSEKYGILDGARRHRCCLDLEGQGLSLSIPCNVVQPPDKLAGLLYMFSIHNFREQWELMPTALSLKIVIDELGETDSRKLSHLTGLSEPQVERCKKLLNVPQHLQELSLDTNPKTRIPSNFWIEALPVVEIIESEVPDLLTTLTSTQILERYVEKYRRKRIRSVIHFRRIVEAFEVAEDDPETKTIVRQRLREYTENIDLETRRAFDEFVTDSRRVSSALRACETFTSQLRRSGIEHSIDADRDEVMNALRSARDLIESLLSRMEGTDPPQPPQDDTDESGGE
jgi:ParB family chromosome partitioning protein